MSQASAFVISAMMLASATLLGGMRGSADTDPSTRQIRRSPWTFNALPEAADHRAEMIVTDHAGVERHVTLTRAGAWQEEIERGEAGEPHWTTLVETGTGLTYRHYGSSNGPRRLLTISAAAAASDVTMRQTGRTSIVAGEPCAIWIVDGQYGSREELCLAPDGILLSRQHVTASNNVLSAARVTSLSRESGNAAALRPPTTLFLVETWFPVEDEDSPPNDDVELTGAPGSHITSLQVRRRGSTSATLHRTRQGSMEVIERPGSSLRIERGADGVVRRMDAARGVGIAPARSWRDGFVLIEPAEFDTILGVRCRRFRFAHPPVSSSLQNCRTDEGLLLEQQSHGDWGYWAQVRATALTRGRVGRADLLPDNILSREASVLP